MAIMILIGKVASCVVDNDPSCGQLTGHCTVYMSVEFIVYRPS